MREHPVPCQNRRAHDARHPVTTWNDNALCDTCNADSDDRRRQDASSLFDRGLSVYDRRAALHTQTPDTATDAIDRILMALSTYDKELF